MNCHSLRALSTSTSPAFPAGWQKAQFLAPAYPDLRQVQLPYDGAFTYGYRSWTFSGNVTIRQVQDRYLRKDTGAALNQYSVYRNDNPADTIHQWTQVKDVTALSEKIWSFNTNSGLFTYGLQSVFQQRATGQGVMQQTDLTWAQDPALNPYVGTAVNTIDVGQSYQKQSKTEQTLDAYGNVTQSKLYDYGNLVTPARTVVATYLDNANYTPRYIRNRLLTSSLNGQTMVSNTYDATAMTNRTGLTQHDTANYGTGFVYRGNPTQTVNAGVLTNITYDITGMVVTATDSLGAAVQVTPASGMNNAVQGVMTPNGATSLQSTTNWDAQQMVATSVTGPNGAQASATYTTLARPLTTASPHGAVTNFVYGKVSTATTNGHWVRTTADGLGRTVKTETGDATSTKSVVDTEYDACGCSPTGKVKRASQPYAPGAGTLYWTTYSYDALGRTTSVALPDNSGTTTYSYQGNATTVTDPAGKWKKFTSDAFGNLTQVEEPNSGSAPVAIAVYNTGVNGSGGLLADGATDSHYTLAVSPDAGYPGPAAKVVNSNAWPIPPWLANGPTSKWIAPRQDPGTANYNSPGNYTYRMTFNLTGYDPATARLTGQWASDDSGTLKLNGTTVATQTGYAAWTAFTITTGFIAGVNTLDFVVNNAAQNPTGLRVEISGTVSPAAGANYITTYTYNMHSQLTGVSMPRGAVTQNADVQLRSGDEAVELGYESGEWDGQLHL